jgi:hypothetical protein
MASSVAILICGMSFPSLTGAQETKSKGSCEAVCEDVEKGNFSCGKQERPNWDEARHLHLQGSECVEDALSGSLGSAPHRR